MHILFLSFVIRRLRGRNCEIKPLFSFYIAMNLHHKLMKQTFGKMRAGKKR